MFILNNNFDHLLKKYYTARIDIKNHGSDSNNLMILDINNANSDIFRPDWFKDYSGSGIQMHSYGGNLDFKIKCINDGVLKMHLRGIDVRDKNGQRFPVYIDFTDFSVNDESVIEDSELTWHDEPYIFSKPVLDSEIVDIHIEWMPFNPSSDFKAEESPDKFQALREKLAMRENQLKSIPQLCCTALGYTVLDGKVTYRNWLMFPTSVLSDLDGYCDNAWFTRFLKHKFPDEDFKINIFGVYPPHENLAYPMEGKKVFYSIEDLNNRCLEMTYRFDKYALDYVDLSMSYDIVDHPKYLRFPYWISKHISPESTEEDIEKKMDYWNSISFEKSKDVAVVTSHDIYKTRSIIANDINRFVDIVYASTWRKNTSEMYTKYNNDKFAFLRQFKFYLCAENMLVDAYVTEKIFDAIHCDCIPLYAGGGNYLEPEIINPKAILRWDADKKFGCNQTVLERAYAGQHANYPLTWVVDDDRNADTVELFKNLLTDKKTYDEFKDQDKVLPSASKQIIKTLSDLEKHFERLIYS